jgi:broad specificity phosphatase PhoE
VASAAREHLGEARGRVLCVLHKGVIKGILAELLALTHEQTHELEVHLGSIHRLSRHGGEWRLETANETTHLGDLHLPG